MMDQSEGPFTNQQHRPLTRQLQQRPPGGCTDGAKDFAQSTRIKVWLAQQVARWYERNYQANLSQVS